VEGHKPRTAVVFADGLDRFFTVNSFPTVMVIDRAGKLPIAPMVSNPNRLNPTWQQLSAAPSLPRRLVVGRQSCSLNCAESSAA